MTRYSLNMFCLFSLAMIWMASSAQAGGHLGAIRLENPNNVPIHYQFKWGADSEWESDCVYPGRAKCHYVELDEHGRAPAPYVRFDCVAGDGDTTWQTYSLDFYATCYTCEGKAYDFRYSSCGYYLDLYEE